jgi:sensor c-di-GMP phosphodiesterase-like protein
MTSLSEIRRARQKGDFFLEYLPIVSLADGHCIGAEALIRWRRGSDVVQPLEFIPQIENTPMSGLLTYWVLEALARELGAWLRTQDDIRIAVNVPPEVFGRGGLIYAMEKAKIADLAPKFIVEITERGIPDRIGIDALNTWPRGGVLLALDDVCASRAGYLVASQVGVDILKLEQATVVSLSRRGLSPAEAGALIKLIRAARVAVIAEGVETADQMSVLRECGVAMAQGWLFSRPLSAADFMAYFSEHRARINPEAVAGHGRAE